MTTAMKLFIRIFSTVALGLLGLVTTVADILSACITAFKSGVLSTAKAIQEVWA